VSYYSDENGNPRGLNESFWAGLFASENIILWEPSERAFYAYKDETGIYVEESVDAIKRRLSDRLLEASRQTNCSWLENSEATPLKQHRSAVARHRGTSQRSRTTERRIHLGNGVFRFDNGGELLPFSPAFVSRNRSDRFGENATCDQFLNELIIPAVHPEDLMLLREVRGPVFARQQPRSADSHPRR
jgi:hypothetical protein